MPTNAEKYVELGYAIDGFFEVFCAHHDDFQAFFSKEELSSDGVMVGYSKVDGAHACSLPISLFAKILRREFRLSFDPYERISRCLNRVQEGPGLAVEANSILYFTENWLSEYRRQNSLASHFFGRHFFGAVADRFVGRLRALDKRGDWLTGSAFAIRSFEHDHHYTAILTCRHNIEDSDGQLFESVNIELAGAPVEILTADLLDYSDVAVLTCRRHEGAYPIGWSQCEVGEEVWALGFPLISLMEENPLTLHRGELNSVLKRGNRLIVSTPVVPGHSGGPILNKAGSAIGMIDRSIEIAGIHSSVHYSSAIPFSLIFQEIDDNRFRRIERPFG